MNDELPTIFVSEYVAWEYKHVARDLANGKVPTEEELNSLGREGWELVGVVREQDTVHLYFKRPKS
ncbi:MAG: DUF4177 domain-containing protein [Candidatus Latescibacterota bacterium]|nr:MAG: DUF4177 domain-containing protein [Candidatus Latescibacterota bacterium]